MAELEQRIAVLEANQVFMRQQIGDMSGKVDEMHSIMLQAKGARWAIIGVAGLAGFLSGKASALVSLFK